MVVDDRARHVLFESLERALGPAPADTLMSYLPPAGWANVATVTALAGVEQRLEAKIDGLGQRLDQKIDGLAERLDEKIKGVHTEVTSSAHEVVALLRKEINAQTRAMVFGAIALAVAFGGLLRLAP